MKYQAITLIGPTASGKTSLALRLAEYCPIEIISMDSALIYCGMDIGTAKPSLQERSGIPHHLIDIRTPLESYNAADFVADAVCLAYEIKQRHHVPVIVGGTMMYYTSLINGLNQLPSANATVRSLLQQEKSQYGLPFLYQQLCQCDPITAQKLSPNDSQRIERALEVFRITGSPMSWLLNQKKEVPLKVATMALIPEPREKLHHHIEQRFHQMVNNGFLEEVQQLKKIYPELNENYPSMRSVGYRQAWQYLQGTLKDSASWIEQGIFASRQLAKRQITRLRALSPEWTVNPYEQTETEIMQILLKQANMMLKAWQ